jgi:TfoX/Sxy family transcriptional regulator of competence genes
MTYDENLADRVRELIATEPGLDERRMFGGLAFLINGNMSLTVSRKGGLLVRVPPTEAETLLTAQAQPAIMGSRTMRGWLQVAPTAVEHPDELEQWVSRAVTYARSLPPKSSRR